MRAPSRKHKVGLHTTHAWVGRTSRRPQALGSALMGVRSGRSGGRAPGATITRRNGGETAEGVEREGAAHSLQP